MQPEQNPATSCRYLLSIKPFKKSSKNKSCAALAARLGVHPKTVQMISNGGYCGQKTARKLAWLMDHPGSRRDRKQDKPRVYTPVNSIAERDAINAIPADRRRLVLLALAQQSQAPQ